MSATFWNMRRRMAAEAKNAEKPVEKPVEEKKPVEKPKKERVKKDGE